MPANLLPSVLRARRLCSPLLKSANCTQHGSVLKTEPNKLSELTGPSKNHKLTHCQNWESVALGAPTHLLMGYI